MLGTKLHWVNGPWGGGLALAARPRGGEWLGDEMAYWKESGVDTVVSLLEPAEECTLELGAERPEAEAHGMKFVALPIVDRQAPEGHTFQVGLEQLDRELRGGRNVVVHCRQGVGRAGLTTACLLVLGGLQPERAVELVSAARGVAVPETAEQREWIEHFAGTLAAAR